MNDFDNENTDWQEFATDLLSDDLDRLKKHLPYWLDIDTEDLS